jgi:hypothetical protein
MSYKSFHDRVVTHKQKELGTPQRTKRFASMTPGEQDFSNNLDADNRVESVTVVGQIDQTMDDLKRLKIMDIGNAKHYAKIDTRMKKLERGKAKDCVQTEVELWEEEEYAPKKTVTAYKLFNHRGGKLYPLFVNHDKEVPVGKWLHADMGGADPKKPTHVKSKLGPLAMRPGWHSGDLPVATHIGGKTHAGLSKPNYRPDHQVWAQVEHPADHDWQTEANKRGKGVKAHITDQVPNHGHYRYKTNPNMTGNWIISGQMKVNRILPDHEVEAINKKAGTADLPRLKKINEIAKSTLLSYINKTQDKDRYFADPDKLDNRLKSHVLAQQKVGQSKFRPKVMATNEAIDYKDNATVGHLKAITSNSPYKRARFVIHPTGKMTVGDAYNYQHDDLGGGHPKNIEGFVSAHPKGLRYQAFHGGSFNDEEANHGHPALQRFRQHGILPESLNEWEERKPHYNVGINSLKNIAKGSKTGVARFHITSKDRINAGDAYYFNHDDLIDQGHDWDKPHINGFVKHDRNDNTYKYNMYKDRDKHPKHPILDKMKDAGMEHKPDVALNENAKYLRDIVPLDEAEMKDDFHTPPHKKKRLRDIDPKNYDVSTPLSEGWDKISNTCYVNETKGIAYVCTTDGDWLYINKEGNVIDEISNAKLANYRDAADKDWSQAGDEVNDANKKIVSIPSGNLSARMNAYQARSTAMRRMSRRDKGMAMADKKAAIDPDKNDYGINESTKMFAHHTADSFGEHRQSLSDYTLSHIGMEHNSVLWSSRGVGPRIDSDKDIKHIDAGIAAHKTDKPITVYSGTPIDPREHSGILKHHGYISASLHKKQADVYARSAQDDEPEAHKHIMKINVPAGHHVAYLDHISHNQGEHEVLLPRGLNLKHNGTQSKGRTHIHDMDIVHSVNEISTALLTKYISRGTKNMANKAFKLGQDSMSKGQDRDAVSTRKVKNRATYIAKAANNLASRDFTYSPERDDGDHEYR